MHYTFVTDAGTTKLRITLLDESGRVIGKVSSDDGVKHTAEDGDNHRLLAALKKGYGRLISDAGIRDTDTLSCIAYGMITSNTGLYEVPHLTLPASEKELRSGIRRVDFPDLLPCPVSFIPGLRTETGIDGFYPDMMRGEETEIIGLHTLLKPDGDRLYVLPGSHNKLIHVTRDGFITSFKTTVSGELLEAMTKHSILADSVERSFLVSEEYDAAEMLKGAAAASDEGFTHAAFSVRTRRVLEHGTAVEARNFLLGTVLAGDLAALRTFSPDKDRFRVVIAGRSVMVSALNDLFTSDGYRVSSVPEEVSAEMGLRGALRIFYGA
ncbi:MAG: 2-dehydro-3-deoxygalactonokinase [Lachnospiraceae bacterium]|nr:2-dehydro-3-deoxygalactonokinase [Lachnospiraceae bacterium]